MLVQNLLLSENFCFENEVLLKPLYFVFIFPPKLEENLFTTKSLNVVCQKQQHYPDLLIYQLYINS